MKIFDFPSCITLQETKFTQKGVKLSGYGVFEKVRKTQNGGGLLTAVNLNLDPVEIESGNEEVEILIVQCQIEKMKLRVINAYGPQEDDPFEKRALFWQTLESDIVQAKRDNCMVVIELDANAKVGPNVICGDPNQMSENGRLFVDLVERESLSILNASPLCTGVITRQKIMKDRSEKSVLDYIVTCDQLSQFLKSMKVDEDRIFTLTKYASTKGVRKIVKSDHNILFADFLIEHKNFRQKRPRVEVFNVKNAECQQHFKRETENNNEMKKCFNSDADFKIQCNNFFKSLNKVVHKSFRKVRVVAKPNEDKEIRELLNTQAKLKKELGNKSLKPNNSEIYQSKIVEIENVLSGKIADRNANIVKEYIESMTFNGKFSPIGMWKLKNKLLPKEADPPMGKLDNKGNLVTTPSALKKMYLDHYCDRLRHRKIEEKFSENYEKKVELWRLRFDYLRETKTSDWSKESLEMALKSLKTNKTRDPSGYINELFKYPVIGHDLEIALLSLVNGVKSQFHIPEIMQMANITTIYKKKGPKNLLENDRGIFILSVFRKIIDRLIYQEYYPKIDARMSDSNIGARKNKNIKNHLFIVYGVINFVLKSNGQCIDIQIYDLVKAFDVLWLEDSMNDLWDTLPTDAHTDRLGLVYQVNTKNLVAVNTAVGQTDRVNISRIITQGGPGVQFFAPILWIRLVNLLKKKNTPLSTRIW